MKFFIWILAFILIGCGQNYIEIPRNGNDGHNSVISVEKAVIDNTICVSAMGTFIKTGLDKNDNGQLDANEIQNYSIVCDGAKGDTGTTGATGANGQNGQNGQNGNNGNNAIVEIINPCNRPANSHNEIFLRLADGNVVCSFSDDVQGDNTHLALLYAGSFMTSDGYACYFNVDSDLTITDQNGNVWKKK